MSRCGAMLSCLLAAVLVGVPWLHPLARRVQGSVPQDLTNFQNEHACDLRTKVVRPRTVADVQDAVRRHTYVMANGEGHSWNQPFFCAEPTGAPAVTAQAGAPDAAPVLNITAPLRNSTSQEAVTGTVGAGRAAASSAGAASSVNIVMTTIRPRNISVLEEEEAVEVDAGVMTWDLIQYLAAYVTPSAPAGWTLPAFPWFVFQSIGGAVATGTHGSSLPHGTLSSQLLSVTLVVANGSLVTLTPESQPLLFRAVRVSLGKLGVITRLKLRIVREQPVKRELRVLPASAFLATLESAQAQWRVTRTLPTWMNETEWFWITQRSEFMMVSFTSGDAADGADAHDILRSFKPDNTTVYNTSASRLSDPSITHLDQLPLLDGTTFGGPNNLAPVAQQVTANLLAKEDAPPAYNTTNGTSSTTPRDVAAGDDWVFPEPKLANFFYGMTSSAYGYLELSRTGVFTIAGNATVEAHAAYLHQPEELLSNIRTVLYDQYEVAIPVDTMADCLKGLLQVVYGDDIDGKAGNAKNIDRGFRTAPLLRLAGPDDGLLSLSGDTPVLFINIEDYLFYNTGRKPNAKFREVMAHLRSSPTCGRPDTRIGLPSPSPSHQAPGGRLHWGKAGWPDAGCWRGDEEYGDKWCDFGCAVRELDPQGKFRDSASDRWDWTGVDLATCCGPAGFKAGTPGCTCVVQHAVAIKDCPPAPFYTNR